MCRRRPLFIFFIFVFFLLCFLSWLDFLLVREIDAHTLDDVNDDDAGVVVVVLRAHNAKTKGFPRREITHHTHALEEEEEEEDFESTTLSWCLFSSLIIIHSRERASVEPLGVRRATTQNAEEEDCCWRSLGRRQQRREKRRLCS